MPIYLYVAEMHINFYKTSEASVEVTMRCMQKKFKFLKIFNNTVEEDRFHNASTITVPNNTVAIHTKLILGKRFDASSNNNTNDDDDNDDNDNDCNRSLSTKNTKNQKYDNVEGSDVAKSFDDCLKNDKVTLDNDNRRKFNDVKNFDTNLDNERQFMFNDTKAEAFNNTTSPSNTGNRYSKLYANQCYTDELSTRNNVSNDIDADNDDDDDTENITRESIVPCTFNNSGKSIENDSIQDSDKSKDNIVDLLQQFKMSRYLKDSKSCGASMVSAYLHNISDCVVRILKCSIEDIDESKVMEIVSLLETYEATLMFLAFNARSFENLSWRSVHNRLRKNCFQKRVMVLCNKYFKNKKVNVVVETIRKYKHYLMNDHLTKSHVQIDDDIKRGAMFYTTPRPNLKLLIKFQPAHFTNEYV